MVNIQIAKPADTVITFKVSLPVHNKRPSAHQKEEAIAEVRRALNNWMYQEFN